MIETGPVAYLLVGLNKVGQFLSQMCDHRPACHIHSLVRNTCPLMSEWLMHLCLSQLRF